MLIAMVTQTMLGRSGLDPYVPIVSLPATQAQIDKTSAEQPQGDVFTSSEPTPVKEPVVDKRRRLLAYRFLTLPYLLQIQIASKFGLMSAGARLSSAEDLAKRGR